LDTWKLLCKYQLVSLTRLRKRKMGAGKVTRCYQQRGAGQVALIAQWSQQTAITTAYTTSKLLISLQNQNHRRVFPMEALASHLTAYTFSSSVPVIGELESWTYQTPQQNTKLIKSTHSHLRELSSLQLLIHLVK
jgi:hypothetical protein